MNYDRFFMLSCLLGDELYKSTTYRKNDPDLDAVEKRFRLLSSQPIGDYITSGLPTFMINKKAFLKIR